MLTVQPERSFLFFFFTSRYLATWCLKWKRKKLFFHQSMMFLQCAEGSPVASISLKVEEARVQFEQTEPHGWSLFLFKDSLVWWNQDLQIIPKSRHANLVTSYPRRRTAVGVTKAASTKHWGKMNSLGFFFLIYFCTRLKNRGRGGGSKNVQRSTDGTVSLFMHMLCNRLIHRHVCAQASILAT